MATREGRQAHSHSHLWLVGLFGLAAGLLLMLYVPSLPAVSGTILLFAGFHLVGGAVLLTSLFLMLGGKLARRLARRRHGASGAAFDFGWAPAWLYGPWVAAKILVATAVAVQVAAPAWWPLAMAATLLGAAFFAGGLAARAAARSEHAVLPMVDLLRGGDGTVLDAGCGAGRTTIALGRASGTIRIVALDRFDSHYIEGGGRSLLEHNLRLGGLADRVRIERGDLTALPFAAASLDAAVSAHAIDHLGSHKEQGLREILRVLKPGGRFLLIVWVPGWTMFGLVNVLCFLLASKRDWRRMAEEAGFAPADEGMFNGYWFALLAKPAA
jgi:SAM-dependent methyltransferase